MFGLRQLSRRIAPVALLLLGISACTPSQTSQPIAIDGSSTVYPITEAIVKDYSMGKEEVAIDVAFSGTGGGFRAFCEGKTDITNASRPINKEEMKLCNNNQVRYVELPIAFDAITVVSNPNNDWLNSLTVEELKRIWEPAAEKTLTRWNQVRPEFPDQPINLYSPGEDSGTFDYFTEAIVGQAGASRLDSLKSEDDDILVQGVVQDVYSLGYFGFAYYEAHTDELKAIAVDQGKGPVLPSRETVEKSEYQPLSRPLFIYVNATKAQENPALREFIDFYLANASTTATSVGYIPLPQEAYDLGKISFNKGEVGTVFEGKSVMDLTIGELLKKQASFE
ncbi:MULTISPECIES: PstS family phosphate ABC transporter substrate-binding protein [unclassified Synechocystis]|uniref:PstS family phosphate ABC transporter substrate-binding protein n=1 Tax=unclassified Synechocystis TaxID=2640012 RepID=UPI0004235E35|nr:MULTISPECIES: PstS family phosphate ABC transporter substrate-binding protein [unclassified Synechocystis]AIE74858.1 Phosphate ABC transporter, periplasmic phosphate-binding protein PstS [Synechocystis sp. PCC 6714]MCT0253421.1 PstS family phosphate ABC transporter substrate-binding protein [Synechocystis sp. CS-94]